MTNLISSMLFVYYFLLCSNNNLIRNLIISQVVVKLSVSIIPIDQLLIFFFCVFFLDFLETFTVASPSIKQLKIQHRAPSRCAFVRRCIIDTAGSRPDPRSQSRAPLRDNIRTSDHRAVFFVLTPRH
jgi:hypothetical protein